MPRRRTEIMKFKNYSKAKVPIIKLVRSLNAKTALAVLGGLNNLRNSGVPGQTELDDLITLLSASVKEQVSRHEDSEEF